MRSFVSQLKQRRVYRVAIGYAIVAWLAVQVAATVLPAFHAPDFILPVLIVLLGIGFPVALVLAWAFDVTPSGIEKTPAGADAGRSADLRYAWGLAGIGLVIAASEDRQSLAELKRRKVYKAALVCFLRSPRRCEAEHALVQRAGESRWSFAVGAEVKRWLDQFQLHQQEATSILRADEIGAGVERRFAERAQSHIAGLSQGRLGFNRSDRSAVLLLDAEIGWLRRL
jgi:hypothetical protein